MGIEAIWASASMVSILGWMAVVFIVGGLLIMAATTTRRYRARGKVALISGVVFAIIALVVAYYPFTSWSFP